MAEKMPKKRVIFSLHAPEAKAVFLAGSFNEWDWESRPMKQDKKGLWKTSVSLPQAVHEYRFVVDGSWENDPVRKECKANPFGTDNSVVRV